MEHQNETAPSLAPDILDLSSHELDSADTATMYVVVNGKPTRWAWTFAGPGHEKAVKQSDRLARERLHEEREKEQARVNGKKWKAPQEDPDEIKRRNVSYIVERLINWSPVRIDGNDFAFSEDAATKFLLDPHKGGIFQQALEFLADDRTFTSRSATTS